jgi:hypothetical protein
MFLEQRIDLIPDEEFDKEPYLETISKHSK